MNILTKTEDGSNTLYNELIGEHYHSAHGALQESKHVFIDAGLKYVLDLGTQSELKVLEVGFGTGLNFMLSYANCEEKQIKLSYTGIEAFPLSRTAIEETAYDNYVPENIWQTFISAYEHCLIKKQILSSHCELEIAHQKLSSFASETRFDLLYFDAFSVRHQPEMWSDEIIAHTCGFLKLGGVFVTYAITGNLKRALKKCGFRIEKLPGAPGKREMLRAVKVDLMISS